MKKIIALMLVAVMTIIPLGVLADSAASSGLEKALVAVKTKISVPEELTEFSSYASERNGEAFYNFDWTDKEYRRSMSVSCDGEGRIRNYSFWIDRTKDKKISSFTKNEIVRKASEFVMKALPETVMGEGDLLVYNESTYDAHGEMLYSMRFDRKKEGVRVKDNYAEITVCEADGELFVQDMYVNYNYDTEFELNKETVSDYESKYKEAFPAEMIYRNEYDFDAETNRSKTVPTLVYRIKNDCIGYIDAVTGEVREEDEDEKELFKNENALMEDSMATGGGSSSDILTPQEIEELGVVEGLLSVSDIEKAVKKLPYVVFSKDLVLTESELSKNSEDKYIYRLTYSNNSDKDYKYANIAAEAKTGKILSLYVSSKYIDTDKALTNSQLEKASGKITQFLNAVAKNETSSCKESSQDSYGYKVNKRYMRTVNGIDYIDNGINVSFDTKNNCITSYRLNFTEGEFENPENAIGSDAAFAKILEYAPIIPLYIVSDGVYKKIFTLDCHSIQLDAVTGEVKDGFIDKKQNYSYTDISGHWVEEAAQKLSEIQIGFEGDKLEPEKELTQKEFLRFIASGIYGKYYAEYSEDDLYRLLCETEIIAEDEKNPDAIVSREDAFIYIIRFAGLEKVAKLSEIYKVSYADENLLSEGKLGYAAILSGLGIVCGNGGKLRPQENLTRAEAITMLYRFLLI